MRVHPFPRKLIIFKAVTFFPATYYPGYIYPRLVKLRRPSSRKRRAGIRQQLQFLQRNLKHIEEMLTEYPHGTPIPIPNGLLRRYWVLPHLYQQQYKDLCTTARILL
ncbi:hypothetical protein [Nitrosomonas ureae]|uniref:hypothetical protein n=1 Tax=Nitrosomonas ureae TaxID=44577 RepID=UPI001F187844|nr:hypothetical protein [Nitrosomonas ureae]